MNPASRHLASHRRRLLCFAGLFWLWACVSTSVGRLRERAHGTVVASVTRNQPRRVVTHTLQAPDGTRSELVCGPTDAFLPRDLAPGTVIAKETWQFGYTLNGIYRLDFPLGFYAAGVLGSCVLVTWSVRTWLRSSPATECPA